MVCAVTKACISAPTQVSRLLAKAGLVNGGVGDEKVARKKLKERAEREQLVGGAGCVRAIGMNPQQRVPAASPLLACLLA